MFFILGMTAITLLIFIPWLWRYRIKPHSEKNVLKQYFKNHVNGIQLQKIEHFLTALYQEVDAGRISRRERKRLGIDADAFIYGEIEFLSFFSILDKVKPQPKEIFYDMGCGSGKAVFAAALYSNLSKACGVELLPALYSTANSQIIKSKLLVESQDITLIDTISSRVSSIHFINDNFENSNISDGDIIFINATCLSYPTWENILAKLMHLKTGSRVIVTTKKIQHEQFKVLHQGMALMSWGMNSVNIYEKLTTTKE